MKWVNSFVFSLLAILLTQFAVGQSQDPFVREKTDPAKMVKLYPNPATDYLVVKFETAKAKTVKVALHNIIGNLLDVDTEIVDDYELRLRVKDLPEGVYLLSIKDENSTQGSFKFLKR